MNYLLIFVLSLVGVLAGSDLAVKGLQGIAKAAKVSNLFVGLTLASIGTSLPEIFTNINASVQGVGALGVGNVIGSCLSQITLIVGLISLFTNLKIKEKTLKRETLWLLIAIINMTIVISDGTITFLEGMMLIFIYLIYLGLEYKNESDKVPKIRKVKRKVIDKRVLAISGLISIVGFAILIISSNFFVMSATGLAEILDISKMLVGIFLVGVGTSLPELILAAQGVLKGVKQISIGVLIGSNITDPLLSLGSGALFGNISVSKTALFFDIPIWTLFTLTAIAFFYKNHNETHRIKGIALIILFLAYGVIRFTLLR